MDDAINGIWWGYFGNKNMHKGIDGICHWCESFLLYHVTCTCGIFCLDMILIEIIQIENPRHVIDAMSSMKLILIFWCFGVSLLCFGLCLWCRKLLQWMELGSRCKKMEGFLLKTKRRMEERKRDRRFGNDYFMGFFCYHNFEFFNCVIFYWLYFVYCVMRVVGLLDFFLKFSQWIEGFFKGLTPCFGFYDFWGYWWCKGVKLPFFFLFQ